MSKVKRMPDERDVNQNIEANELKEKNVGSVNGGIMVKRNGFYDVFANDMTYQGAFSTQSEAKEFMATFGINDPKEVNPYQANSLRRKAGLGRYYN